MLTRAGSAMAKEVPPIENWSSCKIRNMDDMLKSLIETRTETSKAIKTDQGWTRSFGEGLGFREDYDETIASGGWEFYALGNGLYLSIVDMVATTTIPRRHVSDDHLVLSAVINAGVEVLDNYGTIGELSDGYCTYYGMAAGTEFKTVYKPGCKLQWVSVFLNRSELYNTLGLAADDMPKDIRSFVDTGAPLPHTNVMLTPTAYLAARQLIECPFTGGFRKAFLRSKSQELACHILFTLFNEVDDQISDVVFTEDDYKKIYRAMRYLKHGLDEPANIPEIAYAVGMTRQKLQLGFKLVFGNTVARIRDNLRMEYALELVRNSNMPMIEIALETGYEHPASFTRAFKAAFGTSPANMRRIALQSMSYSRKRKAGY
ncbi:helix-turn-helix domain-containing protein [Kordiimonas pumila]|uniref:Helix-turn-helix domain-containing protein n=1 Tax=Kordiimonas pumila TaxID=2161677 RepID=A0ABV7D1H6_9PROT|nr:AraC family transcriptional regulator [Kordiimonas pumila]